MAAAQFTTSETGIEKLLIRNKRIPKNDLQFTAVESIVRVSTLVEEVTCKSKMCFNYRHLKMIVDLN